MIGVHANMLHRKAVLFFCTRPARQNRTQTVRMRTIVKLNTDFKLLIMSRLCNWHVFYIIRVSRWF